MWWVLFPVAAVAAVLAGARMLNRTKPKREDVNAVRSAPACPDSLFSLLQPHLVPFEALEDEFGPALVLVQVVLGLQPSCDLALGIWRPAFRSYNVIVPGCLNLPAMLVGMGTEKALVGLAMYASSRAASCRYCTVHTCSFALRRGATEEVLRAVAGDHSVLSERQQAVADVAWSLGQLPSTMTAAKARRLLAAMGPADAEWIVAAVAMFGSFNKLMDGLGVPLEAPAVAETRSLTTGFFEHRVTTTDSSGEPTPHGLPPRDNWMTYLRALAAGLLGGGAALDARLVHGVPSTAAGAAAYLQQTTGASFEKVFRPLSHGRFVQTIATVVGLNFRSDNSELGLERKLLCAALFVRHWRSVTLQECVEAMARSCGMSDARVAAALAGTADNDATTVLALRVATALAPSPVVVTAQLVSEIVASGRLSAAMLVELVSAIATLQLVHRVLAFYEAK